MTKKRFLISTTAVLLLVATILAMFSIIGVQQSGHIAYAQEDDGFISNSVEPNENDANYLNLDGNDIGNNGNSIYDSLAFMRKIHSDKKNLSISIVKSKVLSVTQFSQSALNRTYNLNHNANINGTCGCVALSTLTYYFSHNLANYPNLPKNINDIFEEYVQMYGLVGSEGTYSSTYKTKLKEYFQRYGYDMKTERTTALYKFTKMRDHADGNRPTIISVSGSQPYGNHAMVVVGYITYKVTYKNWLGLTSNKEETMFVIDEGWGRGRYAYLHEDYMPKDWEITNIWKA